jgi:hypothetical protein
MPEEGLETRARMPSHLSSRAQASRALAASSPVRDEPRIGICPVPAGPEDWQHGHHAQRRRRAAARRPGRRPRGLPRDPPRRTGSVLARRAAVACALLRRTAGSDARRGPARSMGLREHHRRTRRTRDAPATLVSVASNSIGPLVLERGGGDTSAPPRRTRQTGHALAPRCSRCPRRRLSGLTVGALNRKARDGPG